MTGQGVSDSADNTDHPAQQVAAAAQRYREAVGEVKAARARRNRAICQAWQHGATVASLTRATGLGRDSIYNAVGTLNRTQDDPAALADTMEVVHSAVTALAGSERSQDVARAERDTAILRAVAAGIPKVAIAKSAGITARNVYHVIDQARA